MLIPTNHIVASPVKYRTKEPSLVMLATARDYLPLPPLGVKLLCSQRSPWQIARHMVAGEDDEMCTASMSLHLTTNQYSNQVMLAKYRCGQS